MKIFIGQAVRGEDKVRLKEDSLKIVEELRKLGHESYCTFLESNEFGNLLSKDKLKHAFGVMDKCDSFLAIVRSDKKSEGLLIEVGYALCRGLKIISLINKEVGRTTLREVSEQVIEFENFEDLNKKLGGL